MAVIMITILVLLVVASWVYWLTALLLTRSFFSERQDPEPGYTPPVSILKPLRGLDAQIYRNFVSFCEQDYPEYELLFGVSDADDPVIQAVERLQREYPERDIRLFVTPANRVNRKAALLHALAAEARHEVLVASDSDMRVTPDYLQHVVAAMADPQMGLVNCLYRGLAPVTFTARLEALHMVATFLPSVLVARKVLNSRFAMGATVVLRQADLARMGGFAAVADYLADDYQLGVHIANLGLRVHMSDYVVDSVLGPTTFRDQWDREVRWAHCNRVSRPLEYPGMLLTFSTTSAMMLLVATGFAPLACLALSFSMVLRWLVAWQVMGYVGSESTRHWLVWLPLRDVLSTMIWAAGAVGRRVVWRGEEYILRSDGKLASPRPVSQRLLEGRCPALLEKTIRGIDALLQQTRHIEQFSDDERCMFRVSIGESKHDLSLSDGTRIRAGDPVGEIHLWNERIPQIPAEGPDLAWASTFRRQVAHSLRLLAEYVRDNPDFEDVQAFIAQISFGGPYDSRHGVALARRWGFDTFRRDGSRNLVGRFGSFWKNLYAMGLIWVYSPGSVENCRPWKMKHDELWISRRVLLAKYDGTEPQKERREERGEPGATKHTCHEVLWGSEGR